MHLCTVNAASAICAADLGLSTALTAVLTTAATMDIDAISDRFSWKEYLAASSSRA